MKWMPSSPAGSVRPMKSGRGRTSEGGATRHLRSDGRARRSRSSSRTTPRIQTETSDWWSIWGADPALMCQRIVNSRLSTESVAGNLRTT
jgi:hypothetical protein